MDGDRLIEWVCLQHTHYKLTAPANVPPHCNHGMVINRALRPCNKLMWATEDSWAEMSTE